MNLESRELRFVMYMKAQSFDINMIALYVFICVLIKETGATRLAMVNFVEIYVLLIFRLI